MQIGLQIEQNLFGKSVNVSWIWEKNRVQNVTDKKWDNSKSMATLLLDF